MKCSIYILFLVLTLSFPLFAESDSKVKIRIEEFSMKRIPEQEVFGDRSGILLKMSLVHADKKLIGIDIKNSEISFTDDKGTDLFEAGRARKKFWKQNRRGFSFSTEESKENTLSVAYPSIHDKREKNDRELLFQCHAIALPTADARKVQVKGSLIILTEPKAIETQIVTVADLLGGKVMLGDRELKLQNGGSGSYGEGNKFVMLKCNTEVNIMAIELVEPSKQKYTVKFQSSAYSNSSSVEVFKDSVKPTDKVKIEYGVPETETVPIDVVVGPGVSFIR